ncbi:MAG: hypothetical protein AABX37_00710 [Nanoarchaeota archaeon]
MAKESLNVYKCCGQLEYPPIVIKIENAEWRPAGELPSRYGRFLLHHPRGYFFTPQELLDTRKLELKHLGLDFYRPEGTLTEMVAHWWKERYNRKLGKEQRVCLVSGLLIK